MLDRTGVPIDIIQLIRLPPEPTPNYESGRARYILLTSSANANKIKCWLQALSDGYIIFDDIDIYAKIDGPVDIEDLRTTDEHDKRKIAIGLYGPNATATLKKLLPVVTSLNLNQAIEVTIANQKVIVSKLPYAINGKHSEEGYIVLASTDENGTHILWHTLLDAGREYGITPIRLDNTDDGKLVSGLNYDFVSPSSQSIALKSIISGSPELFDLSKPYFIGYNNVEKLMRALQMRTSSQPKTNYLNRSAVNPEGTEGGMLKRTCLYQEHLKLTRRFGKFAGWEMPILYTSIRDEHRAVRETVGLFDVSHMGVLAIEGEHATRFLDLVSTNYVHQLNVGQSQYTYILDPDGKVIDDCYIYRVTPTRYMMVTNAVNFDKVRDWLIAVNSKQYVIDRNFPMRECDVQVNILDLKSDATGDAQRIDLALQGPNALKILQALAGDPVTKHKLALLQKNELIETNLAGVSVIVSRTGYTGEKIGFELFVHPDSAPHLWNGILNAGKQYGIKCCGLGARDSTRIEAGLPLYGHELAGDYDISPIAAGFGAFVKFHKPYFIGRNAILSQLDEVDKIVVRFRLKAKGARVVKPGDSIFTDTGEYVGNVTSCVVIDGGIQQGMAYINAKFGTETAKLKIYVRGTDRGLRDSKVLIDAELEVLPRFPREEIEALE
jgi:glycine cleavage system T protein